MGHNCIVFEGMLRVELIYLNISNKYTMIESPGAVLGQRKHRISVSYYHGDCFTFPNMPRPPSRGGLHQGQNPGLSESCCPPSFPCITLPPTSWKGRFMLFCSPAISLAAHADPPREGPTYESRLPFPSLSADTEKVLPEERRGTPCQEVWQGCGQGK